VPPAPAPRPVATGQLPPPPPLEERPAVQGSDEAAWAENRRSDIVYQ